MKQCDMMDATYCLATKRRDFFDYDELLEIEKLSEIPADDILGTIKK